MIDDRILHALWTKAGTTAYDKSEWKELERLVHRKLHDEAKADITQAERAVVEAAMQLYRVSNVPNRVALTRACKALEAARA